MILPSFFAFTCFDCFACTLPVSFTALGGPVCPGKACLTGPYRPRGVSNTKAIRPLILAARRPRLRRGLLQQRRIVPGCQKRRVLWGGSFPPWSFLPMGIGEQPCQRSTSVWRSRLPPQSFLPVGIGEATLLVASFDFFDFISLRSLSYLRVSGRRHC